jgi:hypothetical protein
MNAVTRLRHLAASDEEIEHYAAGIVSGELQSATPNVVAGLLVRIRELKARRVAREHCKACGRRRTSPRARADQGGDGQGEDSRAGAPAFPRTRA